MLATDEINWSKTVNELISAGYKIDYRYTDHGYRNDRRDILGIEGVGYNVSIDSLGLNPSDTTIVNCERHLLRLREDMLKKISAL